MVDRSRQIQKLCGGDRRKRPWMVEEEIPIYEEGKLYTRRELTLMADHMLFSDSKPESEEPMILNPDMYKRRIRREIYCNSGVPDPEVVSGIYWRTHPQGRKVNPEEQRTKNGASYYR